MFRVVSAAPRELQPYKLASADLTTLNMRYVRHIEARCPVCGLGPKKLGRRQLVEMIGRGDPEVDISTDLPF
jgi:hypothetical protein